MIIRNYDFELSCTDPLKDMPPEETYRGVDLKGAHYIFSESDFLNGRREGPLLIPNRAFMLIEYDDSTHEAEVEQAPERLLEAIAKKAKINGIEATFQDRNPSEDEIF